MTVYLRDPDAYIYVLDPAANWDIEKPLATLQPIEWTWTYSEANAPSMVMSLRIPPPTLALWNWLDPTDRPILLIAEGVRRYPATKYFTNRGFGQRVLRRVRNDDNSVTLTTVFWEQDLIDYSPPEVDRSNWANQADVSLIVGNVLTKVYGAGNWVLSSLPFPGAKLTGSFPTYQALTNLASNPRLGTDATGWVAAGGGGTLSRGTNSGAAYPFQTYARLGIGSGSSNQTGISYTESLLFEAGQQYTFALYGQVAKTGGNIMSARLIWQNDGGQEIGGRAYAASTWTGANWNNRFSITATAPVGAASFILTFYAGTGASAWASSDVIYATGLTIVAGNGRDTDGTNLVPYFDGDTPTGSTGYTYAWQGTANASPSDRTPIVQRDPDALTWKPGQSAWDFLRPILESLGGRLQASLFGPPFAFVLVTSRFVQDGLSRRYVEGVNLYSVTQEADLSAEFSDGTPMFADAVVFRYAWTDAQGVQREAFDAYPTTGYKKPWYQELAEPYPGPGRAQGLYLRLRARASMLTVVVPYDPGLYPSRQVSVTSSQVGGSVVGIIDAVDHDPYAGTSTIRTKNTISYPTNAWITKTTPWSALAGSWAAQ